LGGVLPQPKGVGVTGSRDEESDIPPPFHRLRDSGADPAVEFNVAVRKAEMGTPVVE
jgi:hypothetical protein